jgi:hypothetical protein
MVKPLDPLPPLLIHTAPTQTRFWSSHITSRTSTTVADSLPPSRRETEDTFNSHTNISSFFVENKGRTSKNSFFPS